MAPGAGAARELGRSAAEQQPAGKRAAGDDRWRGPARPPGEQRGEAPGEDHRAQRKRRQAPRDGRPELERRDRDDTDDPGRDACERALQRPPVDERLEPIPEQQGERERGAGRCQA